MTWQKKWGNDHLCPILQSRLRPGKNKNGETYTITLNVNTDFIEKHYINGWKLLICARYVEKLLYYSLI